MPIPTVATPSATPTSSGLHRVRQAAERNGQERFTALLHHVNESLLTEAYEALNPHAAVGTDQVTWTAYGEQLRANITDLHTRVHTGRYRARPTRRVWIPKTDGRQRPLGITALEDKIVQLAVTWVLNAIYETDFTGFSYGFRPGRNQHQALDALWLSLTEQPVNWILDADIQGFFDAVDHHWLMQFLEHRIGDPRILRLIQQWLTAGVCENGTWTETSVGTPQGAVISPLLANIYLHYALDLWVQWWRAHQTEHTVMIVRYADDFIVGFQRKTDAIRFLDDLRHRLHKFALTLHPQKTRLLSFGRFAKANAQQQQTGKPKTFTFLGFTHMCAERRSDGQFTVWRHSNNKRFNQTITDIAQTLKQHRSKPLTEQGSWLRRVVQGWLNYHAIPSNSSAIQQFRDQVERVWYQALRRRSQLAKRLNWTRMRAIANYWLPKPRILHPYPNRRQFAIT